jgi:hypothetical protein
MTVAIQFRDFFPREMDSSFFFTKYAPLEDTVAKANEWIASEGVDVLNVETVLLPGVGRSRKTTGTVQTTGGHDGWYQVVRVWYRV